MKELNPHCYSLFLATSLLLPSALAQDSSLSNPSISAVLDGYYQNTDRPLAERQAGFGLGETELALSANIDELFFGKLTTVIESHDGESEFTLEEAFIQTTALPAGFGIRAGRFLSDIGYLNNQHLHTDAFTARPAVYRAFLGGHYFDDGIRLNYLAPTDLYWSMGFEAFKGESMKAIDEHNERDFKDTGIYTLHTKIGGDIGISSSWQLGLNYLRNENGRLSPFEEEEDEHDLDVHQTHDEHSHSASYTGENTYGIDFVFKWAPKGNYKYNHLAISGEFFKVTDFVADDEHEENHDEHQNDSLAINEKDYHQGWYLSSVYQFSPNWSAGLRFAKVDTQSLHDAHFESQQLKETELSIAWHSSHFSTVRLQYTHQSTNNFDNNDAANFDSNVVTLQYVMSLGAHNAHQF